MSAVDPTEFRLPGTHSVDLTDLHDRVLHSAEREEQAERAGEE